MKSAKDGARTDHTGSLNRARDWCILVQGSMRSDAVVTVRIRSQDSAQMHLAQDNDVVHTLAPDRSDQPFGKAVLPGRGWCNRFVPDAHGSQSACDDGAIDPIAITDHVTRSTVPRKSLGDLACDPLRRRIGCDVDPDEFSVINPYNHEAIQQFKANSRDHEHIHGGNVRSVVSQKDPPSLTWRSTSLDHVLGDS